MAYDSRVFRILIASPSDVEEEREIAVRTIQAWNDLHSYSRKIALLPLRWETHTAPEYGVRPQEIINRAIVDDCDMLVGLFWTRVGSPTGTAESGTLEEIERVGRARKPVMLYFSKIGADPDTLSLAQIELLRQFKQKTYPNGLVEHYKSHLDFRDKFARQLELKVRDLQQSDASGHAPLSLDFLSLETGLPMGSNNQVPVERPHVRTFDDIPQDHRELVQQAVARIVIANTYVPAPLVLTNKAPSGVRNLYVELEISASNNCEVTTSPIGPLGSYPMGTVIPGSIYMGLATTPAFSWDWRATAAPIRQDVEAKLSRFEAETLRQTETGWLLAFEWEALQSQRVRLIKPVVYVSTEKSCRLLIRSRVFSDTFPDPMELEATLDISVTDKLVELSELIPDWRAVLSPSNSGLMGKNF